MTHQPTPSAPSEPVPNAENNLRAFMDKHPEAAGFTVRRLRKLAEHIGYNEIKGPHPKGKIK